MPPARNLKSWAACALSSEHSSDPQLIDTCATVSRIGADTSCHAASATMPVSALKESDLVNRTGSFSEDGILGLKDMTLVSLTPLYGQLRCRDIPNVTG